MDGLRSSDPATRVNSAESIRLYGSRAAPAIPLLIGILDDHTPVLIWQSLGDGRPAYQDFITGAPIGRSTSPSGAASTALSKIGRAMIEPVIAALHHDDYGAREAAAEVFAKSNDPHVYRDPRVIAAMLSAIDEKNVAAWPAAACVLAKADHREAAALFVDALDDGDPKAKQIAVACLKQNYLDGYTVASLRGLLRADNPDGLKKDALGAVVSRLRTSPGAGIGPVFTELATDRRLWNSHAVHEARYAFCRSVIWGRTEGLAPEEYPRNLVTACFQSENPRLRGMVPEAVVNEFGTFDKPDVRGHWIIRLLAQALGDDADGYVRSKAAEALGLVGDDSAGDALIKALSDEDHRVRSSALTALGCVGDLRALDAVGALRQDREPGVRDAATDALALLRAKKLALQGGMVGNTPVARLQLRGQSVAIRMQLSDYSSETLTSLKKPLAWIGAGFVVETRGSERYVVGSIHVSDLEPLASLEEVLRVDPDPQW